MPRKINPSIIRIGSGQQSADPAPRNMNGVVPPSLIGNILDEQTNPLFAHVYGTFSTHPAETVAITDLADKYLSREVEGALSEISALVPIKPSGIGSYNLLVSIDTIPDWGILKLKDSSFLYREPLSFIHTTNPPNDVYPYYFTPPHPAQKFPPFMPIGTTPLVDQGGDDPGNDYMFNVVDGGYPGGGPGESHAGAFTRDLGGTKPVIRTMRILKDTGPNTSVVVSAGMANADRGVLALVHWPAGGDMADFLLQSLEDRCIAALLLGQGILHQTGTRGDGYPGYIFSSGNPDPYTFPGLATGQFDLREIHTGTYSTDMGILAGSPLPAPFNDLDGDLVQGAPAAGQVRLGTDPTAGITPTANGIPILGATTAARGAVGNDNNFFRYRVPYLSDYNDTTGLRFTPTQEKPRFYKKPAVALGPGADLTNAGNFVGQPQDYWTYQLARFRHTFALAGGAPALRQSGTYILLHFKTENAFELLIRDGVVPASSDLYSVNLGNWTDPEDASNLAFSSALDGVSSSYLGMCGSVVEDSGGIAAPTVTTAEYEIAVIQDVIMWSSGVQYFLPKEPFTEVYSFTVNALDINSPDLWSNTYRTYETSSEVLFQTSPVSLGIAPFAYSTEKVDFFGITPGNIGSNNQIKRQRVDLNFQDFGHTLTIGPLPGDAALFSLAGLINFGGDHTNPSFTSDGKMRLFFKRPLAHSSVAEFESSVSSTPFTLTSNPSAKILYHSTDFVDAGVPIFGNFLDGGSLARVTLETPEKDYFERFLDEVYRYHSQWPGINISIDLATQENLIGPGLPNLAAQIEVPVRPGRTAGLGFQVASWIQNSYHLVDLNTNTEAQVAGIPDRNPPFSEGVVTPVPSAGILIYPQKDYSVDYRPSVADGDITNIQPDYSACASDREYVRALDAALSRSASPQPAEGQPFFQLRLQGIQLADFEYTGGGPGKDIAIMVKIPGLTTWMDAGRVNGAGPTKDDATTDGAGCRVIGGETLDFVDSVTGIVGCFVKVDAGVNLFKSANDEVPVLVKVILKDTAAAKNYDFEYDFLSLSNTPNALSGNVRGLIGIQIFASS